MKKVYSHGMIQAQSGYSVLLRSMWFPMSLDLKFFDLSGGGLPIGGRGVVLQRGVEFDEQDVHQQLNHPLFHEYLARWRLSGELFLAYVVSEGGMHLTYEVSRRAMVVEWVTSLLASFEARRQLVTLALAIDEPLSDELMCCLDLHWMHAREAGPSATSPADISINRSRHPLFGHVLFASLPPRVIQQRDQASFLVVLDSLASGFGNLSENWMSLRLNFDGWQKDLQPYEIPAIQAYMRGVMKAAPWWLALVHPSEYVKWFGCLVPPKQLRSRKPMPRFQFRSESLRPFSGMAVLRAIHLLDSTEIDQSDLRNEMAFQLRMSIDQLERGEDLIRSDPLCQMAMLNSGG